MNSACSQRFGKINRDCGCEDCLKFIVGFIKYAESQCVRPEKKLNCSSDKIQILKQALLKANFKNRPFVPYTGYKIFNIAVDSDSSNSELSDQQKEDTEEEESMKDSNSDSSDLSDYSLIVPSSPNQQLKQDLSVEEVSKEEFNQLTNTSNNKETIETIIENSKHNEIQSVQKMEETSQDLGDNQPDLEVNEQSRESQRMRQQRNQEYQKKEEYLKEISCSKISQKVTDLQDMLQDLLNEFISQKRIKNQHFLNGFQQYFKFDENLNYLKILDPSHKQVSRELMALMIEDFYQVFSRKQKNSDPKEIDYQLRRLDQLGAYFISQNTILQNEAQSQDSNSDEFIQLLRKFHQGIQLEISFYINGLPIYFVKQALKDTSLSNKVTLLIGEPGSGKTTQVPKMLYELNNFDLSTSKNLEKKKIICVQPRKVICASLCQKVTKELKEIKSVASHYKDLSSLQQASDIIFMEESSFVGLFVAYLQGITGRQEQENNQQNMLHQVSHVIIDEFDERNQQTDLIIGLIDYYFTTQEKNQRAIKKENEIPLKFIIASSPCYQDFLQQYFASIEEVSTIKIEGRQYCVDVKYPEKDQQNEGDIKSKVVLLLTKILSEKSYFKKQRNQFDGNILVFLQDSVDIQETINFISQKLNLSPFNVFSLHQRQEQYHQVFKQSGNKKKIIFATNIAETSIMIEGVSFVIDCGIEKVMIFDQNKQSNALVVQQISKVQAEQRKACAGRTNPGVCFRLYTEEELNCFPAQKQPEMQRSNLNLMVLQMIHAGISKPDNFRFIEKPGKEIIEESLMQLEQINAVKQKEDVYSLTQIGEFIADTQFEFPLAAILLKAHSLNVLDQTIQAQVILQEYYQIFPKLRHSIIKKEFLDQLNQTKDNGALESDFVIFWKTFQLLEIFEKDRRFGNLNHQITLDLKKAFQKAKQASIEIKKKFKKHIQELNLQDECTQRNRGNIKIQSEKEIQENIIRAYLAGYERQIAVFTGINKLGYYHKASNSMFDIHPSSFLNCQQETKNTKFDKGDFLLYTYLEEQEINSYAIGVSQFRKEWLTNNIIIEELEENLNFEPIFYFEGEKSFLEYFYEREKAKLEEQFQIMQNESGKQTKKGKYYILYEKKYGRISFYCNQYFVTIMEQMNLSQLIEEIKLKYASQLNKKYEVVRFKDTLNFAVIGNGLKIREILLPDQYLKVRASHLPASCTEKQLRKIVEMVKSQGKAGLKDNNKAMPAEIKLKCDYENMSAVGEFKFRKTRHAKLFYQTVSELSQKQVNQLLQIKNPPTDSPNQKNQFSQEKDNNKIIFSSVPECEFLLEYSRDLSKSAVKAQWSISPSLGIGQLVFTNELDAFATLDQLKKKFKSSIQERIDPSTGNPLFHLLVQRLGPKFDEIDLEAYAINHHNSLASVEIRREKLNLSYSKNSYYLEKEERQKFTELVLQTLPNISLSLSYKSKQTVNNKDRITIKISQGVCTALMELDSLSEVQQFVDKLDGQDFGKQKLRLQIQNRLNVPVLGYVYLLSYDAIQKCIHSAAPLVNVKAPQKEDVFYPSRMVFIELQQETSGSSQVLNKIMISLHNILKFHSLFLEFDPYELERIMEKQTEEINIIEKQFSCVFRQAFRGRAEIKIWFGSAHSQEFVEDCKQNIIDFLSQYVSSNCKLNKEAYDLKQLEVFLIQAKKNNSIISYDFSDQDILITGYKQKLQEIANHICTSKQFASIQRQAQDLCLICYQAKQLERISCSCLFCKDCLFSHVKTDTIAFQTKSVFKPVTCPNHPQQAISLKALSSAFNQSQSQLQDLIQLRIDRAVDDTIDLKSQLPQYIRCPSVNCNEFFSRYYPIEAKENNIISENNQKSFPFFVKCKSCYQEYCLANSSKKLEADLPIHPTHPGLSCVQYIKQRDIEQQNMKGIVLLACPKCAFKATKGDGCNHISCKCGAHYCATCLAVFSTPKQVYDHLHKEHQGIY